MDILFIKIFDYNEIKEVPDRSKREEYFQKVGDLLKNMSEEETNDFFYTTLQTEFEPVFVLMNRDKFTSNVITDIKNRYNEVKEFFYKKYPRLKREEAAYSRMKGWMVTDPDSEFLELKLTLRENLEMPDDITNEYFRKLL